MLKNLKLFHFSIILIIVATSWPEGEIELKPFNGFASFEWGALEDYTINGLNSNNFEWLQRSSVYLLQTANIGSSWQTAMGVGVSYFTVIDRKSVPEAQARRSGGGITQASGRYTLGGYENEDYFFASEVGIFSYKYNRHAKNLGEYMFRSRVFPGILYTGGLDVVGNSAAYLTGARWDGNIPGGLHWNLFWNFEMDLPPLKAQSLTAILDYSIADGFIELGAGYQLHNVIYNSKNDIEPNIKESLIYEAVDNSTGETRNFSAIELVLEGGGSNYTFNPEPDTSSTDFNVKFSRAITKDSNVIGYDVYDGAGNATFFPAWTITDSSYLSFAGDKVMARAAINIQKLLQADLLGPDDLSIYGEVIMLNTSEIPYWAETWQERTPMMFGFNLPAFKILDVLSLEFEVYKNKFPLSVNKILTKEAPSMQLINPSDTWDTYDTDDWKFTLYARKQVASGVNIHFQLARDHFKALDFYNKVEKMELTERNGDGFFNLGDFYWLFKFQYMF